jgi:disulfide bond formation protein DsbB
MSWVMARQASELTSLPGYQAAGFMMFGAAGALALALAFEHIGGYAPCPLCLVQRYAYYAAIPLGFVGLIALSAQARTAAGILFLIAGLAFVANTGLGIYHSGIEWGWWPGPAACSNPAQPLAIGDGQSLLESLRSNSVISCSEAPFRFLSLSFAGWSAVISAVLAACGLVAANVNLDRIA